VKHFLKRRWFRTLPNYYLILLVNILIAAAIGYETPSVWKYFIFLQNFSSEMLPFFPESWSLSIEEFAYIFLPLTLLILVSVFKSASRTKLFIIATALLIALCVLLKLQYNAASGTTTLEQWNLSLKMVVVYRLDSIFIGVACS
ncbi:hypothetical protein QUT11_22585, partial [Xanthomonas citri pv. citri]